MKLKMPEIMVLVAPNGARLTKKDHPAIPLKAADIALCAEQCFDAGASMIHVHVRDDDGSHILDCTRYMRVIEAIKNRIGNKLVIQITTESVGRYSASQQKQLVRDIVPEAVSLALRELLPDEKDIASFSDFWSWMKSKKIWPQVILYNDNEIQQFIRLQKMGVFGHDHCDVLFVAGRYQGHMGTPREITPCLLSLANIDHISWSVCAFGRYENACVALAASLGGHIRVGFENNLYMADGKLAQNNADLVLQAKKIANLVGRELVTGRYLRSIKQI
ncbi:MAG: 3-keto-5-aminohexanoate cleavage protein [Pseudomonadota bacterium]